MKTASPSPVHNSLRSWFSGTTKRPPQPVMLPGDPTSILMEMIGREHSGKTALKTCYYKGPLAGPQASGLELAAADPRVMARWMIEAIETYRDLTGRGLVSTLDPEVISYHLYYADEARAILQLREVVGQILTHTTPDSDDKQQAQYQAYVENLTRADVLQVVIGCLPSDEPSDLMRFEADLMVTAGYLREALKVRTNPTPVAVQLLLSKVDAAFDRADESKKALPDERLVAMLGRLVRIVEGSTKVGMAAIFPVSAFGFGATHQATEPVATTDYPLGGFSVVSEGEIEYLLKPGAIPTPFNLTAAVWWAIMAGLMLKPADESASKLADTARMMVADLEAMGAWFVPLKAHSTR
jgi:hypothetical protein